MENQKIKTKSQAHEFLNDLINYLDALIGLNEQQGQSLHFAQQQLYAMRNSVDRNSNEFFDNIFYDKTREEIIEWIESEAKKWNR